MAAIEDYFTKIPKMELHAHLNGSLSEETLIKLQKLQGRSQPVKNWQVLGNTVSTLSSCFDLFQIAHELTKSAEAVKLATLYTIAEFADDNVIYLELRSTPRNEVGMTKNLYIQSIVDGVLEARHSIPKILVKILISINRGQSLKEATENIELALEFAVLYPDLVVGIDFSGDPAKGSFKNFVPILKLARQQGLHITLHCAEIENDREALEMFDFNPERLGHVTKLPESVGKLLEDNKPLLELCVTSNLKCGTVSDVGVHHFGKYYKKHPVILGTDDKGVFNISLSHEYRLVYEVFQPPLEFFWDMNFEAVNFCFAGADVKTQLRQQLKSWKAANTTL